MSQLQKALEYADDYGFEVFPVRVVQNRETGKWEKFPAIPKSKGGNGHKDATDNPEQVTAWWSNGYADCHIGVRPTDWFVVDLDGSAGEKSWQELCQTHGWAQQTRTVRTVSGGLHLYFALPDGFTGQVANSVSNLGPGVDIRSRDGWAVLPGEDGLYQWETGGAMAVAPDWLLDLVTKKEPRVRPDFVLTSSGHKPTADQLRWTESHLMAEAVKFEQMAEGGRNQRLNELAFLFGGAARKGYTTRDKVKAALWSAIRVNGLLDEDGEYRCEQTFESGFNSGWVDGVYEPKPTDKELQEGPPEKVNIVRTVKPRCLSARDIRKARFAKPEFLVDDLFVKGTRLIVTGNGGVGKMTWFRQLGVRMAAGIHPFKEQPVRPVRVLFLDCQDSESVISRRFNEVFELLTEEQFAVAAENFQVATFPQGIDLFSESDATRVEELIRDFKPDAIIGGPSYRMYDVEEEKASHIKKLTSQVFDGWIDRYGVSLFIEAHPPKMKGQDKASQTITVAGSAVWERWCDEGYFLDVTEDNGVERVARFRKWRHPRDPQKDRVPEFYTSEGKWLWNPTVQQAEKRLTETDCKWFLFETVQEWYDATKQPVSLAEVEEAAFSAGFKTSWIRKCKSELFKDGYLKKVREGFGGAFTVLPHWAKEDAEQPQVEENTQLVLESE